MQFVTDFLQTAVVMSRRPTQRILQLGNDRGLGIFRRLLPHIRNADGDRSYASVSLHSRAPHVRNHAPANIPEQFNDPNLPSTSSGLDGDNSRSRSPNSNLEGASSSTSLTKRAKTKTTKRKKRKRTKTSKRSSSSSLFREVRITELNNDGEEEEIVAYVKVSPTSRRKCKKRTKKTRKV